MSNLQINQKDPSDEDYNSIPVHYCRDCLSLKVMRMIEMDDTCCYCDECGSTCIEETNIDDWNEIYKRRYGFTYLNNKY